MRRADSEHKSSPREKRTSKKNRLKVQSRKSQIQALDGVMKDLDLVDLELQDRNLEGHKSNLKKKYQLNEVSVGEHIPFVLD